MKTDVAYYFLINFMSRILYALRRQNKLDIKYIRINLEYKINIDVTFIIKSRKIIFHIFLIKQKLFIY